MVECAQPSHELVATVECFYSRGPQAAMGCRGKQTKGQRKAVVFPQSDVTEEGSRSAEARYSGNCRWSFQWLPRD